MQARFALIPIDFISFDILAFSSKILTVLAFFDIRIDLDEFYQLFTYYNLRIFSCLHVYKAKNSS